MKGGDRLYLVRIPDHSNDDPEALAAVAQNVYLDLAIYKTYTNLKGIKGR